MSTRNVLDFGAAGDASTNDAGAIQRAIDAVNAAGGGTVLIPAGRTFLAGSFHLLSNVNLHLEPGSRIIASGNLADYRDRTLLSATGAKNISITGQGTIDGRAKLFMTQDAGHIYRAIPDRPRLIALSHCTNIRVEGVTLADASNWCLHMTECDDVVVHAISILNDLRVPNCDGIDPDRCRNVRISDCHIEAGDDCIVVKSTQGKWDSNGDRPGACENITVTGCTLISTSCALKIGTETWGPIRNVIFDACTIKSSARGLGLFLRDAGSIENILFSNCIVETRLFHDDWWGKAEPIYVTAFPRKEGALIGRIRNVRFTNILCRGENGVFISGSPESQPENVVLDGVQVEIDKWTKYAGGHYDRRPGVAGIVRHPTAGIYVQDSRHTTIRNSTVLWGDQPQPYHNFALEAHRAKDLVVENFRGANAHPARPPQLIDDTPPAFDESLVTET